MNQNRQRQNRSGRKNDIDLDQLQPNGHGLYSVFMKKGSSNGMTKEEIENFFGAVGDVKAVNITDRAIFIRYSTKEAAAKCIRLYGEEYQLDIGLVRKTDEDISDIAKSLKSKEQKPLKGNDRRGKTFFNSNDSSYQSDANEKVSKSNIKSKQSKKSLPNGNSSFSNHSLVNGHSGNAQKKEWHSGNAQKRERDSTSSGDGDNCEVELFAYNIENKEMFESMIMSVNPVLVRFHEKEYKKYAFVTMASRTEAEEAIEKLDGRIQTERKLSIKFNDRNNQHRDDVSVISGKSGSSIGFKDSLPPLEKIKEEQMPKLEVDYSDMPPLIRDSDIHDPDGRYHIDCTVHVSHFPFQCLESQLRAAFHGYPVSDILMVNNGEASGCSKAILYMATIYDALQVLREMNNSTFFGKPIHVQPAPENVLLRHIFMREQGRK